MKNKSRKTPRKSTLHVGKWVPITDPAIQAALDKLRKMAKPVVPPILLEHARERLRKEAASERTSRKIKKARS